MSRATQYVRPLHFQSLPEAASARRVSGGGETDSGATGSIAAAGRLAFGEPLLDAVRTYLGSALGPMRGRDGNIHRGHPGENELAMISHLGAMVSVTVGTLMAKRFRGEKNFVGLACIGLLVIFALISLQIGRALSK